MSYVARQRLDPPKAKFESLPAKHPDRDMHTIFTKTELKVYEAGFASYNGASEAVGSTSADSRGPSEQPTSHVSDATDLPT